MNLELKDKVAIVTGGGRGIGKAIATALAKAGAQVVVASRNKANLDTVVDEIGAAGGTASAFVVDISSHDQVREMVSQTVGSCGGIDILVNNTGIAGPTVEVCDLEIEDWDRTLAVNLTGAVLCAKEAIRQMKRQKSGNIVNISARAGIHGFYLRNPYAVSKAGLINFTRTLAMEVGKYNIRVNCISPGPVDGQRARSVIEAKSRALNIPVENIIAEKTAGTALGRFVTEAEVAHVAVFLASPYAGGMTGQNITVDAGSIHR